MQLYKKQLQGHWESDNVHRGQGFGRKNAQHKLRMYLKNELRKESENEGAYEGPEEN